MMAASPADSPKAEASNRSMPAMNAPNWADRVRLSRCRRSPMSRSQWSRGTRWMQSVPVPPASAPPSPEACSGRATTAKMDSGCRPDAILSSPGLWGTRL